MKNRFKKIISVILVLVMAVGIVPLGAINLVLSASAKTIKEYSVGDIITFGSYPQSKVTDSATISALNSLSKSWISYGYYSGSGEWDDGKMEPSDYMKYCDVVYNGNKYRAVTFSSYRPYATVFKLVNDNNEIRSYQPGNGYYKDTIYWFKYEPLTWRVLDPTDGYVMCTKAIDSQAYQNYVYHDGNSYYNNKSCTSYAFDWTTSSLRAWMNNDFYTTAFSSSEMQKIVTSNLKTSSDYVGSFESNTYDKIFLISDSDARNNKFGFDSSYESSSTRTIKTTDYALCQGCDTSSGNSRWWLRSQEYASYAGYVYYDGHTNYEGPVNGTSYGIVPSFKINTASSLSEYTVTYNANGGNVSPLSSTVESGKSVTLPTPARSGYTCLGWSASSSATIASYSCSASYKPTANITLYAVWSKNDTIKPTGSISSTNNAASSQTVTLSLSDDVGVAGYYWGTSSTYSNNTYTTTGSSSVTKTISSSGTYYLTVKDTSGNVSSNYSITFYKTTLNANGGSVSPTSVLTKSGNSFTFPTPSKSGYTYSGWATSSTATSGVTTLKPTANTTYYAIWKNSVNIYNLGEETYSFSNYSDFDSKGGHCFGMSSTSSGYYIGALNVSDIGISASSKLYTLSGTKSVKAPICNYQKMQGSYSLAATVAGGTYYKTGKNNLSSDWSEIINYVKDHKYDNKGVLQIGFRCSKQGGHAINFLRYEVVNGQERIYAYDNNFPNTETYFYKNSSGKIIQTPYSTFSGAIDCMALRDMSRYFSIVDDFNATRYIYAEKDAIQIEDSATEYPMDGGIEIGEYIMFEIPNGVEQITIVPLEDNAEFEYLDETYSFGAVSDDTIGKFTLVSSDDDAQTKPTLIIGKKYSISISDVELKYKNTAKIVPTISIDDGVEYTVKYESSNPSVATVDKDGNIATLSKGETKITCTATDEYGNTVKDTCTVTVKFQWWQWLIWIFLLGFLWY